MAGGAAELVDHILPHVPVRQWVLSLPHALRYRLAWDHALCRAVLTIYTRALLGFERRRGRRRGVADGCSGTVTAIQRFGRRVQLNVHFHTLVLEGVFGTAPDGTPRFDPAPPPTDREVTACSRRSARASCVSCDDAACSPRRAPRTSRPIRSPPTPLCSPSSVPPPSAAARRSATAPARPCCASATPPMPRGSGRSAARHAHLERFDLHAERAVRADDRAGLERLCRYLLRPPLAQERLARLADGRVVSTLAHPWHDGTRHLIFTPHEFLERLAAITPRPHINLVLYHGVLAPRARWRPRGPHARARAGLRSDTAAGASDRATSAARTTRTRRLVCVWRTAVRERTSDKGRYVNWPEQKRG